MRIARWICKATNKYSEYVILIISPLQQSLHKHVAILRYTYVDCPVFSCLVSTNLWIAIRATVRAVVNGFETFVYGQEQSPEE